MNPSIMNEVNSVLDIVKSKSINVGGENIDLTDMLNRTNKKSIEYRIKDMNDIKLANYEKANAKCKFTILPDGSDNVVFNKRYENKDICILNFASSKNPGGGFIRGCMAQEEALCHASNLYNILSKHNDFYAYNRNHLNKALYTDGIIFSEKCVFFRNRNKNMIPKFADVITCAAPNFGAARRNSVSVEQIECTMSRRVEQILKVAIANNVRILALGAFGCGVFHNDPDTVANIMATILITRGYSEYFEEILFPLNGTMGKNVTSFVKVFKDL